MAGAFKARVIREEKQFAEEKAKLKAQAERLDEVLEGVTWTLCRKPDSYSNIPGTNLYMVRTDAATDVPPLYIWYTFDDELVSLLFLEIAELPE